MRQEGLCWRGRTRLGGVGNLPEKHAVEIWLTLCRTLRLAKAIPGVDTDALDAVAHTFFSSVPAEKLPASTQACFTHTGLLLSRTQLSSADSIKVSQAGDDLSLVLHVQSRRFVFRGCWSLELLVFRGRWTLALVVCLGSWALELLVFRGCWSLARTCR